VLASTGRKSRRIKNIIFGSTAVAYKDSRCSSR